MLLSSYFAQTNGAFLIVEPVVDHGDADGSPSLEGSTTYRIKLAGLGETDVLVPSTDWRRHHCTFHRQRFQSALNPSGVLQPESSFFSAF